MSSLIKVIILGYRSFRGLRKEITEETGKSPKELTDKEKRQIVNNRTKGEKPGVFYDHETSPAILRLDDLSRLVHPDQIKVHSNYQEINGKRSLPSAQQHVFNILLLRKGEEVKEAVPEVGTTPAEKSPENLTMKSIFGVGTYGQLIFLPAQERIEAFAKFFHPEENAAQRILRDNSNNFFGSAFGESLPVKKFLRNCWERVEQNINSGKFIGIPIAELSAFKGDQFLRPSEISKIQLCKKKEIPANIQKMIDRALKK